MFAKTVHAAAGTRDKSPPSLSIDGGKGSAEDQISSSLLLFRGKWQRVEFGEQLSEEKCIFLLSFLLFRGMQGDSWVSGRIGFGPSFGVGLGYEETRAV